MTELSIAFIALGFPPEVGGTELYNVEYARRLASRGHRLNVLTWESARPGAEAADAALPFEVIRRPYVRRRKKLSGDGIAEQLRAWGAEVAFISRGSRMMPDVVKAAAEAAPVVLSIHELREKHRGRGAFSRWRVRRRYGLDRARLVTVNSADTRARLRDLGVPEERLLVVHPGVDTGRFTPDAEAGARLRAERGYGERPMLLTVSRLAANKGHGLVLDALAGLVAERPELLYVIVGGGAMRGSLEARVAELGLSANVEFAGLVPEVLDYYRACDVFVMASTPQSAGANAGEGFGISYVEAGACGKPVIASDSGGGAEVVVDGETGFVVDTASPGALRAALATALASPERRRALGEAARERVRRYDWERGADVLEGGLRRAAQAPAK